MIEKVTTNLSYEEWEALHSEARFLPRYPQDDVVRWTLGELSPKKQKTPKALDLGCGGGRHAIFLASEGFKTSAVDRSRVGINETIKRASNLNLEIDCKVAEMNSLPYENDHFDILLCYGVLCYLSYDEVWQAISEIERVLKVGGEALIMTRGIGDFRKKYARKIKKKTYLIEGDSSPNYPAAGENGMIHTFLSDKDISDLFSSFGTIKTERSTLSLSDGQYLNDDWLIYVTL